MASRIIERLDRNLSLIAWITFSLGVIVRFIYAFVLHPPRDHVYTDVSQYYDYGIRLFQAPLTFDITDTIWPPGTSFFIGLLRVIDPSLLVGTLIQALMACLIPLLIFDTLRRIRGKKAALVGLIAGSIHFGFIHYVGYFLSELPFIFFIAIGLWFAALGQRLGAFCSGMSFSIACSFRSTIFFVLIVVALSLVLRSRDASHRNLRTRVAQGILGFLPLFLLIAFRCTQISGSICLGSHNLLMNAICGHVGNAYQVTFADSAGELATQWTPPVLGRNVGGARVDVPYTIFDDKNLTRYFIDSLISSPGQFIKDSIRNVGYLFDWMLWPPFYGGIPNWFVHVCILIFAVLIVAPGYFAMLRYLYRRQEQGTFDYFMLSATVSAIALIVMSMLSAGELRYRIPFDFAFIILLVSLFEKEHEVKKIRNPNIILCCVCPFLICFSLVEAVVLYPAQIGFRSVLETRWQEPYRPAVAGVANFVDIAAVSEKKPDGTPWNAPGVIGLLATKPNGLQVNINRLSKETQIELSADHDDIDNIYFYRGSVYLGKTSFGPHLRPDKGLVTYIVPVPSYIWRQGYNKIVIDPQEGDANFAVGHVRLVAGK